MKKIFTNDTFFLVTVICAVIGNIAFGIYRWSFDSFHIEYFVYAGCLITLYVSYKKHNKNVMKGMMGALLMALVLGSSSLLAVTDEKIDFIFCAVHLALMFIIFCNHFIINSTHRARKANVFINQLAVVLLAVDNIVWGVYWIPQYDNVMEIVWEIITIVSTVIIAAVIVCVESRLDAYRLDREAAGWTEEQGYPEGYVHQNEK